MARGDVVVFEEAMAHMLDGGWEPTDTIKCAVLDNTTTPTAADATPALGDYTEAGDDLVVSSGTQAKRVLTVQGTYTDEDGDIAPFSDAIYILVDNLVGVQV